MDDAISRSAVLNRLETLRRNYTLKAGYHDAMTDAIGEVRSASSLDVEPVVRGRWGEYETNPLAYSLSGFPCSVCGMHQDDIRGLYYCPNCGARMDGEENAAD